MSLSLRKRLCHLLHLIETLLVLALALFTPLQDLPHAGVIRITQLLEHGVGGSLVLRNATAEVIFETFGHAWLKILQHGTRYCVQHGFAFHDLEIEWS